jgi:hypothetical protein
MRRFHANPHSGPRRKAAPKYQLTGDGGEGNRTPDLLNAIQALSQLSYAPAAAILKRNQDNTFRQDRQELAKLPAGKKPVKTPALK